MYIFISQNSALSENTSLYPLIPLNALTVVIIIIIYLYFFIVIIIIKGLAVYINSLNK